MFIFRYFVDRICINNREFAIEEKAKSAKRAMQARRAPVRATDESANVLKIWSGFSVATEKPFYSSTGASAFFFPLALSLSVLARRDFPFQRCPVLAASSLTRLPKSRGMRDGRRSGIF